MTNYLISVIIPIFNAEKFLKRTIDSVINQTLGFDNIELILSDDCSTDNSIDIIKTYSNKYVNIIPIFSETNSKTASSPRNKGLDIASGEYIMFLDADDEFISDLCETLYLKACKTHADIVTGNAIAKIGDDEVIDIEYPTEYYELVPNNDLKLFKSFRIWGTIFNSKLIKENNLRFIIAGTNEDSHFIWQCFFQANKIIYLNDYYGVIYYERDPKEHASLTHSYNKFILSTTFDAFLEIKELIANQNVINDFKDDPFIKQIFVRFGYNWDMDKKDKFEILEKVYSYQKNSKYKINLPIQYKIINFFLMRGHFTSTLVLKNIFAAMLNSKFFEKFIIPRLTRNKIK